MYKSVFLKFERYHNVAYTSRRDGDACVLVSRIISVKGYQRNMGRRRNSFRWRDQTRTANVSSRLLAGRGVTVERARWPVTPPPAICAETRCPVSSCLYNGLRGNGSRVIVTRPRLRPRP